MRIMVVLSLAVMIVAKPRQMHVRMSVMPGITSPCVRMGNRGQLTGNET